MMAGFTEKKQALHDKLASTYVIYEDPKAKTKTWIKVIVIVVVVIQTIAIIANIGILVSTMLMGLNSARNKARAAAMKSSLISLSAEVLFCCDEPTNKLQVTAGSLICKDANNNIINTYGILHTDSDLNLGRGVAVNYTIPNSNCDVSDPYYKVVIVNNNNDDCTSIYYISVSGVKYGMSYASAINGFPSGC